MPFFSISDLIMPRACVVCGRRLTPEEEVMCVRCDFHLPRTHYAQAPYDNEMAQRFWKLMEVERAAALFFYEPKSDATRIIREMKYHDHPEYGNILGRKVAREFTPSGFFEGIDALVPLPLAPRRLRERGFNQSMEIAKGISEVTGLPIVKDAVKRINFRGSQALKSHMDRNENVEDSFELGNAESIEGKHVLLIDDVMTTGATIRACGQQLLKAKDVKLSILCLGFTKS